ncbi:MAG TPA: hypothetical protein VK178_07290, partial [Opitutaceae bacterium]|nr:hypothetical protein [Opitutaceae bacterium]
MADPFSEFGGRSDTDPFAEFGGQSDPAQVGFDPDEYLKATDPNWIAQRAAELKRGGYQAAQMLDVAGLQASGTLEEKARQRLADPAAAVNPLDRLVAKLIPGMANALQATPEAVAAAAQQRIDDAQRMRADSAAALATNTAQAAAIPRSAAMREFDQAEGVAGTLSAIARNPVAAPVDLMANSLPASAGGMALGALAGSETGPVGTMAGTFLGSLAPEYAGKMQEVAQSMGVDLRDPKQIEAFFADPEKVGQASALALRKGVPIAVLDA